MAYSVFCLISFISSYQQSISRRKKYDAVFSVHYSLSDKKWWFVIGLICRLGWISFLIRIVSDN